MPISTRRLLLYPKSTVLVSDSFSRADGPIGNAETGQSWIATGGTWVVAASKATRTDGSAHAQCYIELSKTDQNIAADLFGSISAAGGLVARLVDSNNHYLWQVSISVVSSGVLYKKVAGTYTLLATATGITPTSGDRWQMTWSSSAYTIYQNGVQVLTGTDTALTTGTKAGLDIFSGASAIQVDNMEMS